MWDAKQDADHGRHGFGLLVLDGMLVRRVGVAGHYGAELLGPGDVLQLWQHDAPVSRRNVAATLRRSACERRGSDNRSASPGSARGTATCAGRDGLANADTPRGWQTGLPALSSE